MTEHIPLPTRKTIIMRGICECCPKCGQGKIYAAYLKPYLKCPNCAEDFTTIRADDGPAWLTILLTGHLMVPFAITLAMHDYLPKWAALTLFLALTIGIALLILPRAKGIFMGMIWLLRQKKAAGGRGRWDNALKMHE